MSNGTAGAQTKHKSFRREIREAGLVIAYSVAAGLPILIMIAGSAFLLNEKYVSQHLQLIAARSITEDEQRSLDTALQAVTARIEGLRLSIESASAATGPEPGEEDPAGELDEDTEAEVQAIDAAAVRDAAEAVAELELAAAPFVERTSPVSLLPPEQIFSLRRSVRAMTAETDRTRPLVEECACDGPDKSSATVSLDRAATVATELQAHYLEWAKGIAGQSPKIMTALNTTVILIVIAGGASLWCIRHLLPFPGIGTRFGGLAKLRVAAIALAIAACVLIWSDILEIPLMPYGRITMTVFGNTLQHALLPNGDAFFQWNYVAIGLVSSALLLTYVTSAMAAWTYDYEHPPVKAIGAYDRMMIVRAMLYLSAGVGVAAMITVETEFTAAASLFREGTAEDPSPVRALIENFGSTIVLAVGIALGLGLAASYMPAALHLYPAYNKEKEEDDAGEAAGGLGSLVSSEQLGIIMRFLAILAPALAGTLAGIFGSDAGVN